MIKLDTFLPDVAATHHIAESLAEQIKPGQVVYLYGDLGAGKTSLVQGLLKAWHYTGNVSSPTFTLVEPYELPDFTVYHFDFYRINNPQDLTAIGVREYFSKKNICLLEWPDVATGFIPTANWIIHLSYHEDGRKIIVDQQ